MKSLPFLVLVVQFVMGKRAAQQQAESASHAFCDTNASFALLVRSDDEQTEPTGQGYKERCDEELSLRNDATK